MNIDSRSRNSVLFVTNLIFLKVLCFHTVSIPIGVFSFNTIKSKSNHEFYLLSPVVS